MACCDGCANGLGCEGEVPSCAPCADGACPLPQPAQFYPSWGNSPNPYVPNFFPASGCAAGACGIAGPVGTGALPGIESRPSPARAAQASQLATPFHAVVSATGWVGMNLRGAPSPTAALVGGLPNGTYVEVVQRGLPEIGASPGSPMEWWLVRAPGPRQGEEHRGYVRAVGPSGERNLTPRF